jgi:hypothetical protein
MHAFLLSIGVIATAIGMFTIGFGIPINEFSFGNTLIIAGTVSVTGGLILIGIAAAVRQLRRVADAVEGRPPMRRPEPAEPPLSPGVGLRAGPGLARGMFPQKPNMESPGREPRPAEPRLMAVPANNGSPEELPTGRPRPNILPLMRAIADAAVMAESDSVPLSPQASRVAVPASARSERAADVKPAQQPVTKLTGGATAALRSVVLESPRVADRWVDKSQQAVEKPLHPHLFDTLWPAGSKIDAVPADEAVVSAPKPKTEAAIPNERIEPVVSMEDKRDEPRAPTSAASEPPALSVLKSGVIDGMGYTLYTDGTIDAQLSEGTMRFSSIDALRDHLEKIP